MPRSSVFNGSLKCLEGLKPSLYHKDFMLSWEKKQDDILAVLAFAEILADLYRKNVSPRLFQSGLGISIFRDKSTRTRMAFSSACDLLGLTHQEVEESKSQVDHGETVRETANMISFLTEAIGIRDDMYIGRGHQFMKEVAQSLDDGYERKVLTRRPAVINLQSDLDHPTQTLSDLLHLKHHFGDLEALRGKKMVVSWAYSPSYGKPLSVPQGLITLMTRFGMKMVLAHPEGYDLHPETMEIAGKFARESGGSFKTTTSMKEAFADADVVYPKSWAPYWVMEKRTALLYERNVFALEKMEKVCLNTNAHFKDWVCDNGLMKSTRKGNALYLHCLPADVQGLNCQEGEVTQEVFEKYRIDTYKEASHKAFVIAAMIILCCFPEPMVVVEKLLHLGETRVG